MRLGLSSYAYTWSIGVPGYPPDHPLTALQLLGHAARLEVPVVQIADNLPLHLLPPDDVDALAEQAVRLGIQVEVGTRGIAPGHLQEYLALARRFGSPILRVVIDSPGAHYSPQAATALLREHRAAFEDAGVCLAIENHDRLPAAALARMVQDLGPHWVGVCLDTANSLGALEGPGVVVETLGPWTVNLHLKDFAVSRLTHMMGFTVEGRPAGRGQLNVPWLLERLAAYGRELSVILELWTPPEAALPLTVEKEQRWAEESVHYLARLMTALGGRAGQDRARRQPEPGGPVRQQEPLPHEHADGRS
jgi:3-oxoisoapionate decarboxylase